MLKCKHVVEQADALVDGTLYSPEDLSRRQRLALRLHLMMCHHCRRYVRQLRALLNRLERQPAPLEDQNEEDVLKHLNTTD